MRKNLRTNCRKLMICPVKIGLETAHIVGPGPNYRYSGRKDYARPQYRWFP